MFRNKSVDVHKFAMVPHPDVPRSKFSMQKTLKTTFDAGYLVPIFCEEVLPGDTFNTKLTAFCRMATPIFPVMDNLYLETFFFFVPNRLVWLNWKKFMGEQDNPGDSISYTVPVMTSTSGGYFVGSIYDHFGLPTVGQVGGGNTVPHSCLPLRAYNLVYNNWFRDENLIGSVIVRNGDGPDSAGDYTLLRRGKRHDYFTACLPWTQKGGIAISMPMGGSAPVKGVGWAPTLGSAPVAGTSMRESGGALRTPAWSITSPTLQWEATGNTTTSAPTLYADLSAATGATINQLRQSFQIQKLLERDARGGTRYTELVRAHFGVVSPDARLQRPEYLGGGITSINVNPVVQTSATSLTGGNTPLGNLAGFGAAVAQNHGFTYSSTEHGYIIGLASVRADLTYQQGLRKHWSRSTRYDFYFPAFAMLGEQAVLNKEIYCDGSANDVLVFGYQERWAEYRYNPSEIHGMFRSTASGTIDAWHLSQKFTSLPTLNQTFIEESPPLSRVLAVGAGANGQQLLMDAFFDMQVARPLPMYSVPGLIDHF